MKNIFVYILGFLTVSMLFAGTNVWAATGQTVTGSATITDSDTGGPGIDVKLSPNVSLNYNGVAENYQMCGFNSKGTMEYGVSSDTVGIYMHAATALSTLNAADNSTVTTWTSMGSSTATIERYTHERYTQR